MSAVKSNFGKSVATLAFVASSVVATFFCGPTTLLADGPFCNQGNLCWTALNPDSYGQCGGPTNGNCTCNYSDGSSQPADACINYDT